MSVRVSVFANDIGQHTGARRESDPVSLATSPSDPISLVRGPSRAMVLWYLQWWMYWYVIGGVLVDLGLGFQERVSPNSPSASAPAALK